QIGTWNSWDAEGVTINDIVWPGHQHVPPPGVPEKFHLKIVFLEEPPYISLASPDPVTGQCNANRGILCRVATDAMMANVVNQTLAQQNSTYSVLFGLLYRHVAEVLRRARLLLRSVQGGGWQVGTL
ncbi:putative Glutamate receptor ionotropic, NMDA 2A-like 2, partial [Homarus americanus]